MTDIVQKWHWINWNEWIPISYEEYQEMDCRKTLLILDRGKEYYWKVKDES